MKFIILFVLCLNFIKANDEKYFKIDAYERKDFAGASYSVEIPLEAIYNCYSLDKDWQDKIKSIHTHGSCLDVFQEENCEGKPKFIYPGTRSHNNLQDVGLSGVIKSFRLCELDEGATCRICRNPLRRDGPEYAFWLLFFEKYHSGQFKREFQKRASGSWFIKWSFIRGFDPLSDPSLTDEERDREARKKEYQLVLELLMKQIQKEAFGRSIWNRLQRLAMKIRDERKKVNEQFISSRGSRFDSVALTIENIWTNIIDKMEEVLHKDLRGL